MRWWRGGRRGLLRRRRIRARRRLVRGLVGGLSARLFVSLLDIEVVNWRERGLPSRVACRTVALGSDGIACWVLKYSLEIM